MSSIHCFVCKRTLETTPLFRQNEKGKPGVWFCDLHNKTFIHPEVKEIVEIVSKGED